MKKISLQATNFVTQKVKFKPRGPALLYNDSDFNSPLASRSQTGFIMRSFLFLSLLLVFSGQVSFASPVACLSLFKSLSKHEISVQLALASGLHYSLTPGKGYIRENAAQPKPEDKVSFIYKTDQGEVVQDPSTLRRINELKIPPGYSQVWIAQDPLAHIQARALDSRARAQYRYHEDWNEKVLAAAKFERMKEFGEAISKLRIAVSRDLQGSARFQDSQIAAVVRLLEVGGIRIGGEKYAQGEFPSFGLTTLRADHVQIRGAKVRFQFIAKEGIPQDIIVDDKAIARVLKGQVSTKGSDERLFDVKAPEVNQYIKNHIGTQFSAKDFRTWVGTTQAVETLHSLGPQEEPNQDEAIKLAAVKASERLHNTPSVALNSYIDPAIISAFRSGQLEEAFKHISDPELSPAENAVLYLKN